MAVSRRVRFEVFKRDGFACQYCGQSPPSVLLQVDHIIPVHPINDTDEPGSDEEDNLITSCRECNGGKSNVPLGMVRPDVQAKLEDLREREDQLREYQTLCDNRERRIMAECEEVNAVYRAAFPKWELKDSFLRCSVRKFLLKMHKVDVVDAMYLAVHRVPDRDDSIKYFCGICWRTIKGSAG